MVIRVPDLRKGEGRYEALDDRMLVLDFQSGHPEAFVEIHRRYGGLVRHVCQRFLSNQQDVDEAFQETMIRVFQGLYRFNGRYALQPWIARIATNVSLDLIRSQARRPQADDRPVEEQDQADPAEDPEAAVERLVERDLVLSVLSDLPETHRRALVYRELEGLSHKEIASTMEMTPSQAKALIHRAKGSFRRTWMRKVVERGGVAGIALLPLVWLTDLMGSARRLADRFTHVAGASDVVTSTAAATAAPAAAPMGERVVAAAVTVLVAGSVTVGAAVVTTRANRDRPVQEVAAPVVQETEPSEAPVVLPLGPIEREPEAAEEAAKKEKPAEAPPAAIPQPAVSDAPAPSPSEAPAPSPSEAPSPEPSDDPSPDPSPSPEPPPAPPAWSFVLDSAVPFAPGCPCTLHASRESSSVTSSDDGTVTIREIVAGDGVGADGETEYSVWLEYDAVVGPDSGSLTVSFYAETAEGAWLAYSGSAELTAATSTSSGVDYLLDGTYDLKSSRAMTDEAPTGGSLAVRLRTWGDVPVLYQTGFTLGG